MEFFRSFGRDWVGFSHEKNTYKLGEMSLSGNEKNCLFRNDGSRFADVAYPAGVASPRDGRSFVAFDADRDGDLDLFVLNNNQPVEYFENQLHAKGRSWAAIALADVGPNRFGIGARITLLAGGKRQTRELHVGAGFLGSPAPEAHFGLGEAEQIDGLIIRWPDGQVTRVGKLPVGKLLTISREGARE